MFVSAVCPVSPCSLARACDTWCYIIMTTNTMNFDFKAQTNIGDELEGQYLCAERDDPRRLYLGVFYGRPCKRTQGSARSWPKVRDTGRAADQ